MIPSSIAPPSPFAPGPALHYSLWSHDELLGHADLRTPGDDTDQQSGIFEPEPPFERIEPILSALERAMLEFEADAPLPPPDELAALPRAAQVRLMREALGAGSTVRRIVESQRAVDAFALHLRDEHDREVPTQFITVHRLPDDASIGGAISAGTARRPARYLMVARMEERPAR
jgi:hypothetical protein